MGCFLPSKRVRVVSFQPETKRTDGGEGKAAPSDAKGDTISELAVAEGKLVCSKGGKIAEFTNAEEEKPVWS